VVFAGFDGAAVPDPDEAAALPGEEESVLEEAHLTSGIL